jgi:hypothetical protein
MKQRFFCKASNAIKMLLLVISVSLAIAPVSGSHAMMQMDHSASQEDLVLVQHQMSAATSAQSIADCERHLQKSNSSEKNGKDTCCSAFCATYTVSDFISMSFGIKLRPTYQADQNSAVLPGEYAAPHRPPNA